MPTPPKSYDGQWIGSRPADRTPIYFAVGLLVLGFLFLTLIGFGTDHYQAKDEGFDPKSRSAAEQPAEEVAPDIGSTPS